MKLYTLRLDVTRHDGEAIEDWRAEGVASEVFTACGSSLRRVMWWRPKRSRRAIQVRARVRAETYADAVDLAAAVTETLNANTYLADYDLPASIVERWGESTGTH